MCRIFQLLIYVENGGLTWVFVQISTRTGLAVFGYTSIRYEIKYIKDPSQPHRNQTRENSYLREWIHTGRIQTNDSWFFCDIYSLVASTVVGKLVSQRLQPSPRAQSTSSDPSCDAQLLSTIVVSELVVASLFKS